MSATLAVACGGSASESPWPVEPLDTEPGPSGEELTKGNVVDTRELPDNYSKKKKGQPAEEEDVDEEAPDDEGAGGSEP